MCDGGQEEGRRTLNDAVDTAEEGGLERRKAKAGDDDLSLVAELCVSRCDSELGLLSVYRVREEGLPSWSRSWRKAVSLGSYAGS